jgi:amidophosphoribosyltransferase
MSDPIKHECGLAYIRLRKPFSHFHQHYGSSFYGLNKLFLLMEKQHNRGQDGAGIVTIKLNVESGHPIMRRIRSIEQHPIADIMKQVNHEIANVEKHFPDIRKHPGMTKGYLSFMGEVMMGHLRYGTQGRNNIEYCHPFVKADINPNKHLVMAGNFNLVNTKELFAKLDHVTTRSLRADSDLAAMIETIHDALIQSNNSQEGNHNWVDILQKSALQFDGGFVAGGLCGNGDSFILRDKFGIRPCYYYINDEVIVAASERPAIMTCFKVKLEDVQELPAGHALIVKANGDYSIERVLPEAEKKSCSFERIYFSRGSDADIYNERKNLGRVLSEQVLTVIDHDLRNTIFSFIPNTAESAFYGLIKGAEAYLNTIKTKRILSWGKDIDAEKLEEMINRRVRVEKIAIKDAKIRTFINDDDSRNELVQHAYDITYGTVRAGIDNIVIIDDSIVRGTTLRESIIRMLDRLGAKKIIIVSSAPQIRYPDCYGIDMSKLGEFIAFQAAIALLKDNNNLQKLDAIVALCHEAKEKKLLHEKNFVQKVYEDFSVEQINTKIAQMLRSADVQAEVEIIYQSIEGLTNAIPHHLGHWYFDGNYPTPGGNEVVNTAFMNYMKGNDARGY